MTREEIENMPAGREMDKLIAEKIMGWTEGETSYLRHHWRDSDGGFACGIAEEGEFEDSEDFHLLNWHPSESILWSMKVYEHFENFNVLKATTGDGSTIYQAIYCDLENRKIYSCGDADTAPLAICRTALLAAFGFANQRGDDA